MRQWKVGQNYNARLDWDCRCSSILNSILVFLLTSYALFIDDGLQWDKVHRHCDKYQIRVADPEIGLQWYNFIITITVRQLQRNLACKFAVATLWVTPWLLLLTENITHKSPIIYSIISCPFLPLYLWIKITVRANYIAGNHQAVKVRLFQKSELWLIGIINDLITL